MQLQNFVRWLLSNGVSGVGQSDSPLAVYSDDESGERGVAAMQVSCWPLSRA